MSSRHKNLKGCQTPANFVKPNLSLQLTSSDKSILVSFLRQSPLITDEACTIIADQFTAKQWAKNDFLLKAGTVANEYIFLETGFVRSYLYDTEGNEITINFFSGGELVFEVASFFQRTKSQEFLSAMTPCAGWVLSYDQLNLLFHTVPEFREFGRSVLVKGFIAFKIRTLSLINKSAEERYENLIRTNPHIFQNAPLKFIASYLGITDTSLSRIRKSFSKK